MLGLAIYLNRPICRNDESCISTGVLGAALVEIVLFTGIALLDARHRVKAIRELEEMSRQISAGGTFTPVNAHSGDEIGDLARVLNQMIDSLREQISELAEENQQLDIVLDNMADGVLIADDMGRIQLINEAAAEMLNTSEKKALNRSFAKVARHYQLIDLWQICRDERRKAVGAVEIGRKLFLRAFVTPFQENDKLGFLVILQDLTRVRFLQTVRRDFISNLTLSTPAVPSIRSNPMHAAPTTESWLNFELVRTLSSQSLVVRIISQLIPAVNGWSCCSQGQSPGLI